MDDVTPAPDVVSPAPLTGPHAPQLRPDSPLVLTARDLVDRHQADGDGGHCVICAEPYPCPPTVHAALVCLAAGLDPQAVGLPPEATEWKLAA